MSKDFTKKAVEILSDITKIRKTISDMVNEKPYDYNNPITLNESQMKKYKEYKKRWLNKNV